jgi:uncharacterized membrane protein YfcA
MIYLPLAGLSIDIYLLLIVSLFAGFYGGFFSIGGGIIFTPIMIILGVPVYIAIGTTSAYIFGTSFGGFYKIINSQDGAIDYKLGLYITIGSFFGGGVGVMVVKFLRGNGWLDLIIILTYIFCCIVIMLLLSYDIISYIRKKTTKFAILSIYDKYVEKINQRAVNFDNNNFLYSHFPASNCKFNILVLISCGFVISFLSTIIGLGGGIFLIPTFIYLLKIKYKLAANTSVFCTMVGMLYSTIFHHYINHSIDLTILLISLPISIIGARIGISLSRKVDQYIVKSLFFIALLMMLILFVSKITREPYDIFTIEIIK